MGLVDRLFRRGSGEPEVAVAGLVKRLADAVPLWSGRPADPVLVRARLHDACRDAGLHPPTPEDFDARATGLDDEAWRRLAVLACGLDQADLRTALATVGVTRPSLELLDRGFLAAARETPLLTLDLLGRSALRVEELLRRLLAGLGVGVRGESARASRERLERLDYARLLAEAERAREGAAARLQELERLQNEQEKNRPRRGKW